MIIYLLTFLVVIHLWLKCADVQKWTALATDRFRDVSRHELNGWWMRKKALEQQSITPAASGRPLTFEITHLMTRLFWVCNVIRFSNFMKNVPVVPTTSQLCFYIDALVGVSSPGGDHCAGTDHLTSVLWLLQPSRGCWFGSCDTPAVYFNLYENDLDARDSPQTWILKHSAQNFLIFYLKQQTKLCWWHLNFHIKHSVIAFINETSSRPWSSDQFSP